MKQNADHCLRLILKHEGGFVDHPRDPGGATNRGVTIGTLKRLGIDKDGDGDSDIEDLRALTEADAVRVFKAFYWDAVRADDLPSGVDYAVADFAVNSGPVRAAQHLQRALGVEDDGHIGPKTLAAVASADAAKVVAEVCASRLRFMRAARDKKGAWLWPTFGRGWQARVDDVREEALRLAALDASGWGAKPVADSPPPVAVATPGPTIPNGDPRSDWLAGIIAAIVRLFRRT